MPCPSTQSDASIAQLLLALTVDALLAYGEACAVNDITSPLASVRWPDLETAP